jgi:hypothetical protein
MASFHFRSWFLGAVGANGTERTNTLHRKGFRSVLGFRFGFATIMLLASYNLNIFCKHYVPQPFYSWRVLNVLGIKSPDPRGRQPSDELIEPVHPGSMPTQH